MSSLNLGWAYLEMGELDKANIESAFKLDNSQYLAHYHYGILLSKQNKMDSALKSFEKCIQLGQKFFDEDKNMQWCYLDMIRKKGECLMDLDRYDEAKECFQKVLDSDSNFLFANYLMVF